MTEQTAQCTGPGCSRQPIARGLCPHHYYRATQTGTLDQHKRVEPIRVCTVPDCGKRSNGKHCPMHRARLLRTGSVNGLRNRATKEDHDVRFLASVDRRSADECWPWLGTVLSTGYGQFVADSKKYMAHRYAYELLVGPIPDGLQLDHVWARGCSRTDCVNPAHLEPVTPAENLRRSNAASAVNSRKQTCRKGHEFELGNDGKRFCRPCRREWERNHRPNTLVAAQKDMT